MSGKTTRMFDDTLVQDCAVVDECFTEAQLHRLRATVQAHAGQVIRDSDRVGYAVVIVSELMVNAIRHGGGSGRFRLWHNDTDLILQVADQGPGMRDVTVGVTKPLPGQARHRGMWIVRQLADAVTIETGPGGTTVTARMHVQ